MREAEQQSQAVAPCRKSARLNAACVVCGAQNSRGLRLHFTQSSFSASATWIPTADWESFQGTIHGGIIGTVLDEAMSKAIIGRGLEAYTAELRVRFHARICPGDELHVRGWVVEKRRRHIRAEAVLVTTAGEERAHAWGTFLVPGSRIS